MDGRTAEDSRLLLRHRSWFRQLAWLLASWAAVGVVTAVYVLWIGSTSPTIVALSFLLVVLIVAAITTLWVAVATSLVAFLCFNFFFFSPVGTFTIDHPEDWVDLFTLLAVSIVASQLSARARRRTEEAMARRDEVARLFDLTRDILLTSDTANALTLVARFIARRFGFEAVTICLRGAEGWSLHHSTDSVIDIDLALDNALAAAREERVSDSQTRSNGAHRSLTRTDGSRLSLVPLRLGARVIGLLVLKGAAVEGGTRDAIAGVTAIAIERAHLLKEREDAEVVRRSNELKSALLASLSHDLRTPLTAVTVAANNLNASWLSPEQRREQTDIVRSELDRLNRLFQNLVDMARIDTNAVAPEREWVQLMEIVEAAVGQVEHALANHQVDVDITAERTLVRLDPRLTSAALAHILENAAQYSPPDSPITIQMAVSDGEIHIVVCDRGSGVADEDLEHLFERFYRGSSAALHTFGTGMGLAITRGLLAAQGGRVSAANAHAGGAVFTIAVPAETQSAAELEEQPL